MTLPLKLLSPLKLPTADYNVLSPNELINLKIKYVEKGAEAFTEAGSIHSWSHLAIGNITDGLAIIAYNHSKHLAAAVHLKHSAEFTPMMFEGLLSLVGKSEYDPIQVHMIGCSMKFKGGDYNNPEAANREVYLNIKNAYEVLESHKGQKIRLETFDVYQKDKPQGILFNALDGKMTSLSRLRTTLEEAVREIVSNKSPVHKYLTPEGKSALKAERNEVISAFRNEMPQPVTKELVTEIFIRADEDARRVLSKEQYNKLVLDRGPIGSYLERFEAEVQSAGKKRTKGR